MVEQIGKHEKICPYLHLPVQSGSDSVLRRMGRGYTRGQYVDLIHQLRQARPDLALSTDLIVGFPGESEEDFEATLSLLEEVRFAALYAFRYSPRPGTAAPRLGGDVDPEVAGERLQRLLGRQESIQREINQDLVGRNFDIVVTGWGRQPGTQTGRTPCHRIVHFETSNEPVQLGTITKVHIETAFPNSLLGRRISVAA
jgi:tRNA-2-methylthio-N6-dimethylallyladenosine synthase